MTSHPSMHAGRSFPEWAAVVRDHPTDPFCGCGVPFPERLCVHTLSVWAHRGNPQVEQLFVEHSVAIGDVSAETRLRASDESGLIRCFADLRARLLRGERMGELAVHRILLDPDCGATECRAIARMPGLPRASARLCVGLISPLSDAETRSHLIGMHSGWAGAQAFAASSASEIPHHLTRLAIRSDRDVRVFWNVVAKEHFALPPGIAPIHLLPFLRHPDNEIRRRAATVLARVGVAHQSDPERTESIFNA